MIPKQHISIRTFPRMLMLSSYDQIFAMHPHFECMIIIAHDMNTQVQIYYIRLIYTIMMLDLHQCRNILVYVVDPLDCENT